MAMETKRFRRPRPDHSHHIPSRRLSSIQPIRRLIPPLVLPSRLVPPRLPPPRSAPPPAPAPVPPRRNTPSRNPDPDLQSPRGQSVDPGNPLSHHTSFPRRLRPKSLRLLSLPRPRLRPTDLTSPIPSSSSLERTMMKLIPWRSLFRRRSIRPRRIRRRIRPERQERTSTPRQVEGGRERSGRE